MPCCASFLKKILANQSSKVSKSLHDSMFPSRSKVLVSDQDLQ